VTAYHSCLVDTVFAPYLVKSRVLTEGALVSVGVLFIALLAQVSIPLYPVPITGQSLAVLLIGASFGMKRSVATTFSYVLCGAAGLPFFASGGFGFGVLIGATGGYLIGFVVAAAAMGFFAERGYCHQIKTALAVFMLGHVCIFACGMIWLGSLAGLKVALAAGFVPFIPGIVIKTTIAALILPTLVNSSILKSKRGS